MDPKFLRTTINFNKLTPKKVINEMNKTGFNLLLLRTNYFKVLYVFITYAHELSKYFEVIVRL